MRGREGGREGGGYNSAEGRLAWFTNNPRYFQGILDHCSISIKVMGGCLTVGWDRGGGVSNWENSFIFYSLFVNYFWNIHKHFGPDLWSVFNNRRVLFKLFRGNTKKEITSILSI